MRAGVRVGVWVRLGGEDVYEEEAGGAEDGKEGGTLGVYVGTEERLLAIGDGQSHVMAGVT